MSSRNFEVKATPVEYLATTGGISGEDTVVVVTVRMNPGSFQPTNLELPAESAVRLMDDLKRALVARFARKGPHPSLRPKQKRVADQDGFGPK